MNLLSLFEEYLYSFIEAFVFAVNNHANSKKYVVVIVRTKINKKIFKRKIVTRASRYYTEM